MDHCVLINQCVSKSPCEILVSALILFLSKVHELLCHNCESFECGSGLSCLNTSSGFSFVSIMKSSCEAPALDSISSLRFYYIS